MMRTLRIAVLLAATATACGCNEDVGTAPLETIPETNDSEVDVQDGVDVSVD